jgi:uncharacterized protein (DUF111 family)
MNLLYIDAKAGVSGDMLLAAMIDLGLPVSQLRRVLASFGLGHLSLKIEKVKRIGVPATRVTVRADGAAGARSAIELTRRVREAHGISGRLRASLLRTVAVLAAAEAGVHKVPPEKVFFYQIGRADTLVAMVGFCFGLDYFGVGGVYCSTVPVSLWHQDHHGHPRRSPGPATVRILKPFRTRFVNERFERTTPTGAALLAAFASPQPAPPLSVSQIGRSVGRGLPPSGATVMKVLLGKGV